MLAGLLFSAEGVPFTPSHAANHGRRYRYYVERPLVTAKTDKSGRQDHESESGLGSKGWRLPANEIEKLVLTQVAGVLKYRGAVLDALPAKRKSPDAVSAVLTRAAKLAEACETDSLADQVEIVTALVRRVAVGQDKVAIDIERKALATRLIDQEAARAPEAKSRDTLTIEVPVRFRWRGVEAKLLVQDQGGSASRPDPNLVKALARAHEWFGRIVRSDADGIGAIARAERLDRSFVTRLLCLVLIAPDTTKMILQGRQPPELTAKRLTNLALKIPLLWADQIVD